jgi:hypothetical protein
MIVNIEPTNFGGQLRAGDLVGVLNYLAFLHTQPPVYKDLKFYIPDHSVNPAKHCLQFRDWLIQNTQYLSAEPGEGYLNLQNANLWDIRSVTGDVLKLKFDKPLKKKICVFPLLDAPYNHYRNWSIEMVNSIIDHYMQPQYEEYEKILCMANNYNIDQKGFVCDTDYIRNIEHIIDCSHFVGGDTGTSHFASVLDDDKKINYYYGSVGLLHTTPFYALQGRGNINMFWNNNWRTDLL